MDWVIQLFPVQLYSSEQHVYLIHESLEHYHNMIGDDSYNELGVVLFYTS
jgi:hypothetical protein